MFVIDGIEWDIPCDIERKAEIKSSSNSGTMLDKTYFNDVLGTYLVYTVKLVVPADKMTEYAVLYGKLTDPDAYHIFVFPYNNTRVYVTARVSEVSDVFVRLPNGKKLWRGLKFTATASNPTKTRSLGEVVTTGIDPLPDVHSPAVGDTYTYTTAGWVRVS